MLTAENAVTTGQARRALARQAALLLHITTSKGRSCCSEGKQLRRLTKIAGDLMLFSIRVHNALRILWRKPYSIDTYIEIVELERLITDPGDDLLPRVKPSIAGSMYIDSIIGREVKLKHLEIELHNNRKCICHD